MAQKNYISVSAFMRDFIATNGKNVNDKHRGLCSNLAYALDHISPGAYHEQAYMFNEFLTDTYKNISFPIEGCSSKYLKGHKYRGKRLKLRLKLAQRYLNWVKTPKARRTRIAKIKPGE